MARRTEGRFQKPLFRRKTAKKGQIGTWQSAIQGLNGGLSGVPAHLSARLCASLKIDGDRNSFLLGIPAGQLKGKKPVAVFWSNAQGRFENEAADLSKTAGADASQGLTLNPR